MEIQLRRGNAISPYISFYKVKIMVISINENQKEGCKSIHFNFTTMLIHSSFQPSCLANITKMTRKTWNKIDATPVLNRNGIFRRWRFDFVNRSKRNLETETRKDFRDFKRDRIKRQNYRIETWVRMTDRMPCL